MVDIAELGLEFRSDSVRRAERDLQTFNKTGERSDRVARNLSRSAERLGRNLGRAAALYATAVAGFAANSVRLAVDAEEVANKFAVVFRGSVEETDRALQNLTSSIPATQTQLRGFAATVQDLLVPLGLARDEAAGLSVDAVTLAGDLASFNNTSVDQALNAIRSALVGSSEPMRQFGVDTRETRLEAIALTQGIIQQGEEMDGAARAAAVFAAITADSGDALGDAARTAGSAANQTRFLKTQFTEISEGIGRDLIPAYTQFITYLNESENGVSALERIMRSSIVVGAELAKSILLIASGYQIVAQKAKGAFREIKNTFEDFAPGSDFGDALLGDQDAVDRFTQTLQNRREQAAAADREFEQTLGTLFELISTLDSTIDAIETGSSKVVTSIEDAGDAAEEASGAFSKLFDIRDVMAWIETQDEAIEAAIEAAEEARNNAEANEELRQSLIDQVAALQGGEEAWVAYQKQQIVSNILSQVAAGATEEFRREIEMLARSLADLEFPEEEIQSFTDKLSEAFGEGLQQGLANGINQIDAQDVLDGNFAEIGENLGRSVLTSVGGAIGSIGGPIGQAIGSLIGDIIGEAIFGGGVPKFQIFGSSGQMDLGTDLTLDGPLGQLNFAFREIESEAQTAVRNAFVQFDTVIAGAIRDTDQLTQIDQALQQFGVSSRSNGESIEGLLQLRFDTILSTFDQATQSVVRAAGQTLEEQVQALADVQAIAVQEALGRGLGLDNALPLISELQVPGEALATTFARLRDAAAVLDTTMALTGATFGATREEVLRFGQGLADAFGGDLQRASSLLGTIFGTFFTEAERLEVRVEQSTARAVDLLAQIGIDATDEILSRGGFRELFDSLADTLSPADLAILIEAGAEIAALIGAEEGLAEIRADSAVATNDAADATDEMNQALQEAAERQRELSQLLFDVGISALQVIAPARAEFAQLTAGIQDTITRARNLGATEEQLNLIRQASEIRIRGFIASLSESIASLTQQLFGAGPQIDALGGTLNIAAGAATNFRDQWLSAIDAIGNALDAQLLGPNSTLTAAERQQESLNQFQQALAAAQGGDLGAAQSLPQLFQQALAQGASFFGSTSSDFAALEAQLRAALENADLPVPPDSPDVQTAQNTLATSQGVQQVEQTALQQLTAAAQLIDQIGLLADLTGQTPAEIGTEFGIPIAELIGILTGEVPDLTGDALSEYFDELVAETNQQLNELAQLESIANFQLEELRNITELLGGVVITKPDPDDGLAKPGSFADGGPVQKSGMAMVHAGEFVVPREGALISGRSSAADQILAEIRDELRLTTRQNEDQIRATRTGNRESVSALMSLRDEQRKRPITGKAALTRA